MASASQLAQQLWEILNGDLPTLKRIDKYLHGLHDGPYMPPNADDEYRLLADRSVSNWMPTLVNTPAQALYVDGFRRGSGSKAAGAKPGDLNRDSPEWDHWQSSRMDARQRAVHRGALGYGHSFVVTEKDGDTITSRGLSAMRATALFEDPANDDAPVAALYVKKWPEGDKPGKGTLWTETHVYEVAFPVKGEAKAVVFKGERHGFDECPVTRFAAHVDLDGRTIGVIEPMIPLQNRINQSVFDLLVAQTYGSHKVRWATGMAPPVERDPETGDPKLDDNGNPIPVAINHNARRFLFAEDHEVKFGSLDETPLGGFIESIDMSIRHLAAVSQTPPHHLLGQIANLSAEALQAAETSLARMVEEFKKGFGESWERVFRLAAQAAGDAASAEDFHGEVIWRDMESRSLAQSADALGKLSTNLGIPQRGLWHRVPGATENEVELWQDLHEEDNKDGQLVDAVRRASGSVADVNHDPVPRASGDQTADF